MRDTLETPPVYAALPGINQYKLYLVGFILNGQTVGQQFQKVGFSASGCATA